MKAQKTIDELRVEDSLACSALRGCKTQEIAFILYGAHPHWHDILIFYTDGVFLRKETAHRGNWSIEPDEGLKLAWLDWDAEILAPSEKGYEAGAFVLMNEEALSKQHISATWFSNSEHRTRLHSPQSQCEVTLRGRKVYALTSEKYLGDIIYHTSDSLMIKRLDTAPEFYTLRDDGQYHLWQAPQFARKQKVGILYICTGRYDMFWESFYSAAKKNLFLEHDVHYYVFTDSDKVQESADVTLIKKPFSPWPHDLLHRYHTFIEHEEIFSDCDFLYFFNANCLPAAPIGNEVFPDEQQGLLATLHYGYCYTHPGAYTYERNPQSCAYIPWGCGYAYFAGGFNGGRRKDFMRMSYVIKEGVDSDSSKGLIALWHDESHSNRYLLDQSPLIVAPNYLLPNDAEPYTHEIRAIFSPYLKTICRYKGAMINIRDLKQLD